MILAISPHWGLVGEFDGDGGSANPGMFRIANEQRLCANPDDGQSKFTVIRNLGHSSIPILDNSQIGNDDGRFDPFDMSVYEWLLQFEKVEQL